jgi:hypothetical protein
MDVVKVNISILDVRKVKAWMKHSEIGAINIIIVDTVSMISVPLPCSSLSGKVHSKHCVRFLLHFLLPNATHSFFLSDNAESFPTDFIFFKFFFLYLLLQ